MAGPAVIASFATELKILKDEKNYIDFRVDHRNDLMCQYDCDGQYDVRGNRFQRQ